MGEQDERFYIDSVEQLRAIADPLRMRLMELLLTDAFTATQLAERLGEAPAKVHYHVRELERAGLVKLVETREKGGILEKYYRAVAKNMLVSPTLIRSAPIDETVKALEGFFNITTSEALEAIRAIRPDTPTQMRMTRETVWMADDEFTAFNDALEALLEQYVQPRSIEGEKHWTVSIIAHKTLDSAKSPTPPTPPIPPVPPIPPIPPTLPANITALRRVFVIGVYGLERAYLDELVAQGAQVEITVFGACFVEADISADLIRRTVRRARITGMIQASDEVRQALQDVKS